MERILIQIREIFFTLSMWSIMSVFWTMKGLLDMFDIRSLSCFKIFIHVMCKLLAFANEAVCCEQLMEIIPQVSCEYFGMCIWQCPIQSVPYGINISKIWLMCLLATLQVYGSLWFVFSNVHTTLYVTHIVL